MAHIISKIELSSFDQRHCIAVMKRLCRLDMLTQAWNLYSPRAKSLYCKLKKENRLVKEEYYDLKDKIFLWLKPLIRDCVMSIPVFKKLYPDIVQEYYIMFRYDFAIVGRLQKCTIGHMGHITGDFEDWYMVRDAFAAVLTGSLRALCDRMTLQDDWQRRIKDVVVDANAKSCYPSPEDAMITQENQKDFARYLLSIPKNCPYDPRVVFIYTIGIFVNIKKKWLNFNSYTSPDTNYIRYTVRRKAMQCGYHLDELRDESKINGLFTAFENEVYERCQTETLMVQV